MEANENTPDPQVTNIETSQESKELGVESQESKESGVESQESEIEATPETPAPETTETPEEPAPEEAPEETEERTEPVEVEMPMRAAVLDAKSGVENAIINFLKDGLTNTIFDAVLVPYKVPTGESFVYMLIHNPDLLDQSSPIAPIMPTQGGQALASITRQETGGLKIAAVIRPCETRAAIELSKLSQCDLENITLISYDCPGVLPTAEFIEDPNKAIEMFNEGLNNWNDMAMRPVCLLDSNSNSIFGDLHFGRLGVDGGTMLVIQKTQKGKAVLDALGLNAEPSAAIDTWKAKTNEMAETKRSKRKDAFGTLRSEKMGLANLQDTFSTCINCHNCMRVCPVDYCQQCYFECDDLKFLAEDYFQRANAAGSLNFPPDVLLYHMGRMIHMTMSCVSCGTCEDACPVKIPVAQIYSSVADEVQGIFDYLSGRDPDEPRPLLTYSLNEFSEIGE